MDQELKTKEQSSNGIEVYCDGDAAADLDESYRHEVRRLRQSLNAAELTFTSTSKKEKRTPSDGVLEDLLSAIDETDLDLINRILKGSWNLNITSKEGVGPLHVAARTGSQDICRALIRSGASVRFLDHNGSTPANIAALCGKLSEFNHAVTDELLHAASSNEEEVLRSLIEDGWNVNSTDAHGLTALHKAAAQGNEYICRFLLKNGASLHAKDIENETALQKAEIKGQSSVVQYLIQNGAELPDKDVINASNSTESKSASPFQQVIGNLSILMIWKKRRLERAKSGHIRLNGDSSRDKPSMKTDGSGPSSPELKKKGMLARWSHRKERQKSLDVQGSGSPSLSEKSCDDVQCRDTEHHLWGQFLDPGRRRYPSK